MNNNAFSILCGAMPQRRRPREEEMTPEQLLASTRVTPTTELPPMEPLFRMYDVQCFYRGELVAVCGKAKSGKTLFLSTIMAKGCSPPSTEGEERIACLHRFGEAPLRVLWIDTEQSAQSTQDILVNRILPLAHNAPPWEGIEETLHAYNLRGMGFEKRRQLMEVAIASVKPDLVVIDGIKDLVTDINDAVQATLIMEQLMALAQQHHCCLVCVLHQNKSEADHNMRGSIGTELTNKAFEVYACDKDVNRLFSVEQTHTRKYDLKEKLYYSVDADGLPHQVGESKASGNETVQKKYPALNHQYVVGYDDDGLHFDLVRLFCDALGNADFLSHFDLQQRVMELSGIRSYQLCSNVFREAVETKIIVKEKDADQHVVYRLTPF